MSHFTEKKTEAPTCEFIQSLGGLDSEVSEMELEELLHEEDSFDLCNWEAWGGC